MLHSLKRAIQSIFARSAGGVRGPSSTLGIIEVRDAAPLAGELFFRAFAQPIPDFPRHFVLACSRSDEQPFALGYVHQTAFESSYLAGGLVVDVWKFRGLSPAEKDEIRERGGMAEWLMTESCRLVHPCDAVFGHIGDPKALIVDTRVGFRPTEYPYLYVLPASAPASELFAISARVAALGPF